MNRVELAPGIYHLQGGANMGLVVQDGRGLLIDVGLGKDAARHALRAADELGVTLDAVFVTHAHADHFGGLYFLQKRGDVPAYAPALEAAMMAHPIIEPLYLFCGAAPIGELRGKFTLARPARIDHPVDVGQGNLEIGPFQVEIVPLPGHALNQVGIAVGDVLFCADAVFPAETLDKHKITFCVDMEETLATLKRLPEMPYAHFAPGHGPVYAAGDEITQVCAANRARLEEVCGFVFDALETGQETTTLLKYVADCYGLHLKNATAYFLTRTTVLAALSMLERAGKVVTTVVENRLQWRRADSA